ncbi:thrombospondin type 3 repeat-containing protein, partial [Nitrospirota bacterium]
GENYNEVYQVQRSGKFISSLFLTALILSVLSYSLIGCGGGTVTPHMSIDGIVSKGLVSGGTVTVYRLTPDGTTGRILGTGTTGANGAYSINSVNYSGNILVEVAGGTYTDEATGNSKTNGTMRAVITNYSGDTAVSVTALTEIAVQKAGTLTTANMDAANASVSTLFGFDIVATAPADVTTPSGGTQAQKDYGLALAAISQMADDMSLSVSHVISQLAADLSDNTLETTGASLSTSFSNFVVSLNNQSGLTLDSTSLDEYITTYTSTPVIVDTTAPAIPAGLTAVASSSTQIDLTWSASTDDVAVTGYNIYRNTVNIASSVSAGFNDTGLTVDTQYCYTVSAYDGAGNESQQSVQACDVPFLDSDGDGIPDYEDLCPYEYGTVNGCPDSDGDWIPDWLDLCPYVYGTVNGCPDTDGDGFPDYMDNCPSEFGTIAGCP